MSIKRIFNNNFFAIKIAMFWWNLKSRFVWILIFKISMFLFFNAVRNRTLSVCGRLCSRCFCRSEDERLRFNPLRSKFWMACFGTAFRKKKRAELRNGSGEEQSPVQVSKIGAFWEFSYVCRDKETGTFHRAELSQLQLPRKQTEILLFVKCSGEKPGTVNSSMSKKICFHHRKRDCCFLNSDECTLRDDNMTGDGDAPQHGQKLGESNRLKQSTDWDEKYFFLFSLIYIQYIYYVIWTW